MITPYRIILDTMNVECNYPGYVEGSEGSGRHYSEKELLARGDFVKDTSGPVVKWYHYITEEQFKELWEPNIFYYISDPLLKFLGKWDIEWTENYNDLEDML